VMETDVAFITTGTLRSDLERGNVTWGDLYAVQAALTALTQEVKLQGRSFKQLGEAVGPVAEMAPALASLIEDVRLQARREVLDGLLDLRDRLGRGEETAALAVAALDVAAPAGKTSWWRR